MQWDKVANKWDSSPLPMPVRQLHSSSYVLTNLYHNMYLALGPSVFCEGPIPDKSDLSLLSAIDVARNPRCARDVIVCWTTRVPKIHAAHGAENCVLCVLHFGTLLWLQVRS